MKLLVCAVVVALAVVLWTGPSAGTVLTEEDMVGITAGCTTYDDEPSHIHCGPDSDNSSACKRKYWVPDLDPPYYGHWEEDYCDPDDPDDWCGDHNETRGTTDPWFKCFVPGHPGSGSVYYMSRNCKPDPNGWYYRRAIGYCGDHLVCRCDRVTEYCEKRSSTGFGTYYECIW